MFLYSVGDEWTTELPDGDSYGFYWQENGGLWLLAAAQNLTAAELQGFREGHCEFVAGSISSSHGGVLLNCAVKFANWGYCESATGNTEQQEGLLELYQRSSAKWRDEEKHGTLTAFLLERTNDGAFIAALRFFTLSPHVTKYCGKVLAQSYSSPQFQEWDYLRTVMQHQERYPTSKEWVTRGAAVRCRAGD